MFVVIDGFDIDFIVKLVLVDGEGIVMNMVDGIIWGRYCYGRD